MHFAHDVQQALEMAVDLVNTRDVATGEERLARVADLRDFVVAHTVSGVAQIASADLVAVRAVRERLRLVFETGESTVAVAVVNELVAEAGALPQLTDHDGEPLHLHFTPPGAPLARRLAADAGMGLAVLLRDEGTDRLRVCAAPDCAFVLVDTSRNRSRLYCDARACGNRLHAAAYRARRRLGMSA